ncbi:uncharacterized protein K441DRAFT_652365 [Cenococcum geophilum 1.58]|uniref:uncharacterized protein n=1 Tax=Cenococcum geophilum 1.58 TaxID=794803 RepID=UPI00358EDE5D|nr:hypothetical protein K441DRAFT_652365 [Cenococcum geophilum 1.58]
MLRQSLNSSLLHLKARFALEFLYTSLPYLAADGSKLLYTTLYTMPHGLATQIERERIPSPLLCSCYSRQKRYLKI